MLLGWTPVGRRKKAGMDREKSKTISLTAVNGNPTGSSGAIMALQSSSKFVWDESTFTFPHRSVSEWGQPKSVA